MIYATIRFNRKDFKMPDYITKHMPVDDYPYIAYVDEADKEPQTEDEEPQTEDDNESDDNDA